MAFGTRLGFLTTHQGGAYGYSFKIRYRRDTDFGWLYFFLPVGWGANTPSVGVMPFLPIFDYRTGGTLYNPGHDATTLQPDSFVEEIALSVSNIYYGIVVTSDYRPGGDPLGHATDPEKVYLLDQLDDRARATQRIRDLAYRTDLGFDRPLDVRPQFHLVGGTSSGAWQTIMTQLQEDGKFPYDPHTHSDDEFAPRSSHCCGPIFLAAVQTVFSGFHEGMAGYSHFGAYGLFSWAGAWVGDGRDDPQGGGGVVWADVPMEVKRLLDTGEYAHINNPRCREIGAYLSSPHINTTPRGNIVNEATGSDPKGFGARYWRKNGGPPAPIGLPRAVVSNVQSLTGAAGEGIFRHDNAGGETWVTQGYQVGDTVASDGMGSGGFGAAVNNDEWLVKRFENSNKDMVVDDPGDTIQNVAASPERTIAGGGLYDLHDEAHAYILYDELVTAGSTKSLLRAGGTDNTNPNGATTGNSFATIGDLEDWLEDIWGWVRRD